MGGRGLVYSRRESIVLCFLFFSNWTDRLLSYFGKQSGNFNLVLRSVCARSTPPAREDEEKRKNRNAAEGRSSGSINDTQNADVGCEHAGGKERGKGSGWLGWFSGFFTVS